MKAITFAVGIVSALAIIATATTWSPQPAGEARTEHVRELNRFVDLGPMVAASDAVVLGTVSESREGRAVGDKENPNDLVFTEVVVEVDDVLFGALSDGPLTLEIDISVISEVDRWDVPKEVVLLFLHEKLDRPGFYRPTNSQGVFVLDGDRVEPGVAKDDFAESFASVGRGEAIRLVRLAAIAVQNGLVTAPPKSLD